MQALPCRCSREDVVIAESFVQVAPDSTGKQLRTETSTQGANTVHSEVIVVSDSVGSLVGSSSNAASALQVALQDSTATAFLRNSASNLAAATQAQAQMVAFPGFWTATSAPVVATLASASKAAGGAGVVHVCTGISVSWSSDGTNNGAAQQVVVALRNGASGAGTILWQWNLAITTTTAINPTNYGQFSLSGLSIPGSANTAMTLEFTGTASSHEFYTANICGYYVV